MCKYPQRLLYFHVLFSRPGFPPRPLLPSPPFLSSHSASPKQVSILLAQQSGDAPSRKAMTGSSKIVTNFAPPPPPAPPAAGNSARASSTPSPVEADAAAGSSGAAGGNGGGGGVENDAGDDAE